MDENKTTYEVATEGVAHLVKALDEFVTMSSNYHTENADFTSRYDRLLELLQENDAFNLKDKAQIVLDSLGVGHKLDSKVATLSGGQFMRLALARILISKPDILLLDEPTNHLDLHANLWLRQFLNNWQGGLLIVSHDRDFLNEVTTSTLELAEGEVHQYGGNFEFYKQQKGLQESARERESVRLYGEVKKAKKQIDKEKKRATHSARRDLIKKPEDNDKVRAHFFRERAAKTAGRKKRLSEGKRDEATKQLNEVKRKAVAKIYPHLKESESHKGKLLIFAQDISCAYGDSVVIENGNMSIQFGDRIALFGGNGAGKSTWIKGLLGWDNVSTKGDIKVAQDINVQLLDQRYAIVDRNQTVLENLQKVAAAISRNDIRQHLARFLFRETTEVNKSASVLSGGEIARLALAIMAVQPVDLLVLDEPTNNLDVESIEQIENVLREFRGAILVVSHDMTFLRNIGVSQSCVVSDKTVKTLISNPSDGERFKNELLTYL